MVRIAISIWIIGIFSIVPYCIYYLFFEASKDEIAFYLVFPLFWLFGYWGVAGPLISAYKVHCFFKALENAKSAAEIKQLMEKPESFEMAVDFVATENKLPKFIARKIVRHLQTRFADLSNDKHQLD